MDRFSGISIIQHMVLKHIGKFISYKSMMEKVEEEELHFWGCMTNDELIGVIAIKGMNHICLLFVKKEYHRQGIARRLCQKSD
ncbi:GNAT family N-acetyltransferase [Metabacillus sediminilitoris]|nr:GNAT family N-acetyltransferase [Metabacillus sediminilitoris]